MRANLPMAVALLVTVLAPPPLPGQAPIATPTPTTVEAWAAYGSAGPEHAVLARRVGSWDVTIRTWSAPGATPREKTGHSEWQAILGGLFFEERFEIPSPEGAYTARGLAGFDRLRRSYVSTWVEADGTAILHSEGRADATGKILTFASDSPDPVHGTVKKIRTVETEVDARTWTMEAYRTDVSGREYRSAEFVYHRR